MECWPCIVSFWRVSIGQKAESRTGHSLIERHINGLTKSVLESSIASTVGSHMTLYFYDIYMAAFNKIR